MSKLCIPYAPRDAFKPYHANKKRFSVTVAHRRAGKTVARLNRLIREAVESKKLNPRYGYLAPFYVQAKEIAWNYLKHYTAVLAPLGVKYHEADLSITFGHNNATIRLYGAENAERMRGLYFDGIVPDEAQGINAVTLRTIILPCLADRTGWLDISGTPRGWENLLGEVVAIARDNPQDWFLQVLKASETHILPESELAIQRKLMSLNEFRQEYECDFDAAITGAIYGQQIAKMEADGRIKADIYDPAHPVMTAWDLGYDDSTAIWFWQFIGGEIRLIDCYENSGEDIAHYCEILRIKPYKYGKHYVPHDAANKLLAAGGRSIVQQAFGLGVKMYVVAATSQQNQIEALRVTMDRMWIDSSCKEGIAALKQYQFEFDDDKKTFRSKPKHDWSSHYCFVGQTKVLTRRGTHQIMNLPQTGEVLTLCGWQQYTNPRVTRRNAQLVEVVFTSGYMVRCTPEHLFMTESGWKSAEFLVPNTAIQSTLTNSRSILMAVYIVYGLAKSIYRAVAERFIEMCGGLPSGKYLPSVISIIKTEIQGIIALITSNAWMEASICGQHGKLMNMPIESAAYQITRERKPPLGIGLLKADCGIKDTQRGKKTGVYGQKSSATVNHVALNLRQLLRKVVSVKSIALGRARPLCIASVRRLDWCEDVWCITVENGSHFSLSNGAVVHNCDACEIIGQVWRNDVKEDKPSAPRFLHEATANEIFWPSSSVDTKRERI